MNITQKTIAKKAKVSQATVSLVLNGLSDTAIPKETARKVLAAAGKLGYRRRAIPLNKNGSSTKNIGYLISSNSTSIQDFLANPYYARFVSGLTHYSEKNKYRLIMYNKFSLVMQSVLDNQTEGLIVEADLSPQDARMLGKRIPAVFLNWKNADMTLDSVMPDNTGGVKKAVVRLYALGHRNIAFFGMESTSLHAEQRIRGYLEGLKECGLEEIPDYLQLPKPRKKGMEEMEVCANITLKTLMSLENKPTALIAMNDNCALPLIRMAHKHGMRLPEELSVIGFDNRISCRYSTPSLSSIEQPMEEMAKKAMILLLERIENPDKPIESVVFDVELIERESVCENKKKTPVLKNV
ncbi:MAG: LacI family DNA-binding transcriptional regulator [Candidatus Omnitrophica bacterium]|nr:LacI family DNA-binding transcriptional regulator [Candidatus Omnitrophota bacterium]